MAIKLQLDWRDGTEEVREGDPLELLSEFVQSYEMDQFPDCRIFKVVSWVSSVMIMFGRMNRFLKLPMDDLKTPDLFFYLFDRWASPRC